MKRDQDTVNRWWHGHGRMVAAVAAIAFCCSLMAGCNRQKASEVPPATVAAAKAEDTATRQLREIGDRAAIAMLAKDANTLLEFDHNPEDAASLNNKSGDLYCFLFDSSCIAGAKGKSVYELFSTSKKLAIDASVSNVPVNGKIYGLLMFYDKSQVSDEQVYKQDFLCSDKALKETAAWHFVLTDGKWSTSTLFDYKIERPCKQQAESR
jgi:hypothetical protein